MNENHEMLYSYIELIRTKGAFGIKLNPFYMVLIQTNNVV